MTTLDGFVRRAAADRPDHQALLDAPNRPDFFGGEPERLTWREVDQAVESAAAAFAAAGVEPGAAVAIQLPNVVELPIAIMACIRLGAKATPFPIQHRQHELRYGLGASGARHLVTAARPDRPDQLEAAAEVLAEFDGHLLDPGFPHDLRGVRPQGGHVENPADEQGDVDAVATICWTSGTTGVPKGVPRTHAMWLASADVQIDQLDLTADERILCPFPVVNMAGIGGMLVPWLVTGSTLALHHPIDLPVFLGQIGSERITYTVAPPPLLNMLLRNEAMLDGVDMSALRKISSGSAPLDPWMVEGWHDRGIEIVNVFGSNEGAALLSTATSVPDPGDRARYFPMPANTAIEVRLVEPDGEGEIDEIGSPGELRFRGPTIFAGYLDSDGAEFDADGFYRTGDVFEWAEAVDGSRLLRFVDRAKDIVIRGGMNVSAAEVEALISAHDDVAECAVIGYPDADLGERVGVFVAPAEGADPSLDDIVDHLRVLDVASYKLPERLELIEVLPRNPVGKIDKPSLRTRWLPDL